MMMMRHLGLALLALGLVACDKPVAEPEDQATPDTQQVAGAEEKKPVEHDTPSGDPSAAAQSTAAKPDYAREQRMIDEISDSILDGDVVTLNDGQRDFAAVHMEAEGDKKGAVIILHGRGFHADWVDTINPLRVGLPTHAWDTLSLQMPVLEKAAKYYDYLPIFPKAGPRIEAGIQYLHDQGIKNIVLLAHSCGAHMAMTWIEEKGDDAIQAYVGLGMGATDYKQPMLTPFPLDKMNVPVLDLYGANEYPAVIRRAPERKAAMEKAGNPLSRQEVLPDADHYFTGINTPLVESVAAWLEKL